MVENFVFEDFRYSYVTFVDDGQRVKGSGMMDDRCWRGMEQFT